MAHSVTQHTNFTTCTLLSRCRGTGARVTVFTPTRRARLSTRRFSRSSQRLNSLTWRSLTRFSLKMDNTNWNSFSPSQVRLPLRRFTRHSSWLHNPVRRTPTQRVQSIKLRHKRKKGRGLFFTSSRRLETVFEVIKEKYQNFRTLTLHAYLVTSYIKIKIQSIRSATQRVLSVSPGVVQICTTN